MLKFKKTDNYDEFEDNGAFAADEGFDTMEAEENEDAIFGAPAEPAPAFGAPATAALKIVNPKEFKDAVEIANLMMNGNTVLMNVEGLEKDQSLALRVVSYLQGAVHVAGGVMTRVSKSTIVVAPKNVDVSSIETMVSAD
ncbi:MAG: cell division protein SepF [Clostridia bacterium]|nr:cell division protein SepF [Clostridia bacterium]